LLCARRSLEPESVKQIRLLSTEDIDWDCLVNKACAHKLQFLLYRCLKSACSESLNHPALVQLDRLYLRNVAYSLRITRQFFEIMDLLGDHGIQAMPFKGPVLSELAYGDHTLRPIGDLDLLVDRQKAFRSLELLIDQGFRTELALDFEQFWAYSAKKNGMALYHPGSDLTLDLHWEMTGNYAFEPLVLSRMSLDMFQMDLAGRTLPQPCLETLLIYLCLCGTRDCWKDLESVSAVSGLIAGHHNWDWLKVQRIADRLSCRRMASLGLLLAFHLFDSNLPSTVLNTAADDPIVSNLASEVCQYLLAADESEAVANRKSKFSTFHIRARDRWPEKLRYCKHLLLNATDQEWRSFPLPAGLSFLHTLLRPLRLSMTFLSRTIGHKGPGIR